MSISKLKMNDNKSRIIPIASANKLKYVPSSTTFLFSEVYILCSQTVLSMLSSMHYCLMNITSTQSVSFIGSVTSDPCCQFSPPKQAQVYFCLSFFLSAAPTFSWTKNFRKLRTIHSYCLLCYSPALLAQLAASLSLL